MAVPDHLLLGALVVLAAVAVPFAITTALRHNDPANRLWSGALLAALGAGTAPLLDVEHTAPVDLGTAGAACAVVTFGLLWSGARWFRGVDPRPFVALGFVVLLVVVRLVLDAIDSPISPTGYTVAAAFAVLTIVELHRGPMALNLNVSILQVALGVFAVGAFTFVVVTRSTADRQVSSATLLLLTSAVCAQMLAAVRAERSGAWWSEDHGPGRVHGVHTREQFLEAAADRLGRLGLRGGHAALVLAEVSALSELNEAFGRRGGDVALSTLADTLRRHVPAWSVLGYLGAGRFAVLAPAGSVEQTAEIATALERALYARSASTGQSDEVPVPVLFGIASTFDGVTDVNELLAMAARSTAS